MEKLGLLHGLKAKEFFPGVASAARAMQVPCHLCFVGENGGGKPGGPPARTLQAQTSLENCFSPPGRGKNGWHGKGALLH